MKKLNFKELFAMGVGFTIGSAAFSLTGVGAMYTGGSVFLAYIVGAIAILLMMSPVIIAASVVPRQGVSYTLSKEAFGHSAGGFYFWIFFIGRIAMLANSTAFAIYFTSVFTTLNPQIVATVIIAIFYITNYFGLKSAAKVQLILNIVLYAAFALFIIFGLTSANPVFVFNEENFIRGGASGFLSAVSLLVFAMGGGMAMLELGGSVEKPEKNLPKACLMVTLLVGLLYAGLAYGTVGALPFVGMADGGASMPGTLLFKGPSNSVVNAATALFSNSTPLLYAFIFGGMCLAVATTINGSFGWYSAAAPRAAADGWYPKWLTKENKHGSLYRTQAIFALAAIVPVFFAADLGEMNTHVIKAATGLQILANIIPNFGLLALPKLYPEQWAQSKFHMGKTALILVTIIPSVLSVVLLGFNVSTYAPGIQIALAIITVAGLAYALIGGRTFAKKRGNVSVEKPPVAL